jgi:hypothetical protein
MEKIYKEQLVRMGNLPASLPNATPLALPSRIQSLKTAIGFDRDVTVKASSKNELNLQNLIKRVKFLVSTLCFLVERCV